MRPKIISEPFPIKVYSSSTVQIHVITALELVLASPINLSNNVDDTKKREQNVRHYKVCGRERRQSRPALQKGEYDVCRKAKVGDKRICHSLEGKLGNTPSLHGPTPAETDVDEANGRPDEECADTRKIHDVSVRLRCSRRDIHHGDGTDGIGDENSPDGDAAAVNPAENLGRFARLGHVQHCSGADVDGRIDGGQTSDEDECVDKVNA